MFQAAGNVVRLDVSPGGGLEGTRNATLVYYSEEEAQAAIGKFNGSVAILSLIPLFPHTGKSINPDVT